MAGDAAQDPGPQREDDEPVHAVAIELPDGSVRTIDVPAHQSVLERAWEVGLDLPSSCLVGWCITCAARVLEGELDHSAAQRYYHQDERAGFALLCVARPLSPLRLRSHATEAMREVRVREGLPVPRGS